MEVLPNREWITLRDLQGRRLLDPYVIPYEDLKYRFMRVRGRGDNSLVTTRAICVPGFPLSWMLNPQIINGLDKDILSPIEKEMVKILNCFWPLSSYNLITLDCEDGNGME